MTIICKAFNCEVDDGDYPCSMCFCGANDFQKNERNDSCEGCTWEGCTHPECPVSGCIDRTEDICHHKDNFEKECEGICGCPYKKKREVAA